MKDFLAFDFSRYAPPRPVLVSMQPDVPARPGELGQCLSVIGNCLALIRQCSAIAVGIIWRRSRDWFVANILQSLTTAWIFCGVGWGFGIGAAILF